MSVVLMRGKIGSGKSHRARELCDGDGMVLLSVDAAMEAVFGTECMGRENHLRAERGVLDYFLELTVQLSSAGHSVVIDHGFWSKAELKRATDYFDAHGIAYTVVETEADFETRLARVVNRTNGKRFDKEKLLRFDSYYEE